MIVRKYLNFFLILIIPEISIIVSYFIDGECIKIMRVLHQKQQYPPK